MTDTTVYSCVTGKYDKVRSTLLASPLVPEEDVRYVLFTDAVQSLERFQSRHTTVSWELHPLRWRHPLCSRRTARWHKLHSHLVTDTTYSVWVDGSQKIKARPLGADLVQPLMHQEVLAAFKHPDRTCVYQELQACRRLRKDNPQLMQRQINRYQLEGYSPFHGLAETACVIRERQEEVIAFNELWWEQLEKYSLRDQLSFNYTAWRLGLRYGYVPGHRSASPFFDFVPHGHG